MSKGHVETRNALLTPYNGELDGAILAYIEEVNLGERNEDAAARIKDFVTNDTIWINAKYINPYKAVSHLHFIQVSNFQRYVAIFPGETETRTVMIEVAGVPDVDIPWEEKMKPALKKEAPDFLRTLFDMALPEGVGRLWLPVLETRAKVDAVAVHQVEGAKFDPDALDLALRLQLVKRDRMIYQGLVHDLLKEIGKGPWSDDPGQFGKQIRELFQNAIQRGYKHSIVDTKHGSEVTYREQWDEENLDPLRQYVESVLDEESAILETIKRQEAAEEAEWQETETLPEDDDQPLT